MDTASPAAATPVALAKRPSPLFRSILVFIAGMIVGGALVWFVEPMLRWTPEPWRYTQSGSPDEPSDEVPPSPFPTGDASDPAVTFRTVEPSVCTAQRQYPGRYMVVVNGRDTGIVPGDSCNGAPTLVANGDDWAIVQVQPEGLGGYIIYGRFWDTTYLNTAGVMKKMSGGSTDIGFSADDRFAAYTEADTVNRFLVVLDLQTGVAVQRSAPLPGGLEVQPGRPTFSSDASKIAFVIWYGPDDEHGDIYVVNRSDPTKFTKVGTSASVLAELFWRPDGTVGWR